MSEATPVLPVGEGDKVRLAPGVILRHDRAREQWMLLGPERVLVLDDIALEVVRACTATAGTQVGAGVDALAEHFNAPREEIAVDVLELLQDMLDRGFLSR